MKGEDSRYVGTTKVNLKPGAPIRETSLENYDVVGKVKSEGVK